jgi:hypothetical protein
MYKRQAPSVEQRAAPVAAVAPASITAPHPKAEETKKYAADDLEVPSFLRRR